MSASWREFSSWRCASCGEGNIIVESASGEVNDSSVFERSCLVCGVRAPGATIRPVNTVYRITTAKAFYPGRFRNVPR